MIYYNDGELIIRNLTEADVDQIVAGEREQGWNAEAEKYESRLRDEREGKAISLAAEYRGKTAGYINVYPDSAEGPFGGRGWPEIVDFGVLEKYRKKGIGGRLMDAAEQVASKYGGTVYLGVGLHSGYGSAQRMYVKRGYIPDGTGVWYDNQICAPYAPCRNDDGLILYLSKKLLKSDIQ